mgnify:CR=1 FL=1
MDLSFFHSQKRLKFYSVPESSSVIESSELEKNLPIVVASRAIMLQHGIVDDGTAPLVTDRIDRDRCQLQRSPHD